MIGSGKQKGGTSAEGEQSWRDLAGPRRSRVNSPQARKRRQLRLFKFFGSVILLVLVILGAVWSWRTFKDTETALPLTPTSKPIERIIFDTDGVLPDSWLTQTIQLHPGMLMMDADIYELKQALESNLQVKSASVERVFPSDLRIRVSERTPALRLAVQGADGKRKLQLVARDGKVYDGLGYPAATLKNMPFVLPYKDPNRGYFPMNGIESVDDLLELARRMEPEFFRTWQVVSLEHYSGDPELPGQVIEVRSALVPRIIFSASSDYERQLERLAYILDYVNKLGNPSVERIDLSLRGSAAVQFSSGRVGTFQP
jgi:cell division septal protein FtsQ